MPIFLEVARQSILLNLRSKLYLAMIALSVLFALVFSFMPPDAGRVRGNQLFEVVTYGTAFTAFIPFVTLFLAAQTLAGDLEDRTSVYLFTRPIHRASLLVGKWLSVIALGGVFVTIGMSALFAVISFGGRDWALGYLPRPVNFAWMLLAAWIAVVGYSAVGCFFASFFRRPMLIGVLYIFLEQFASRLPPEVSIHNATVAFPIRVFMFGHMPDASYELQQVLKGVIDGSREQEAALMATDPYLGLLKITGLALGLAILIYTRREYDSRPRD